ncbi:hypothetical protein ACEPAI_6575 [Sanghuangporus weigelae]
MAQNVPLDDSSFYLSFASDSLINNTITCDELGIRYRIYTPPKHSTSKESVTSFYRWDREVPQEMLVAELEKQKFSHRVRIAPGLGLDAFGPEVPFVPVTDFFPKNAIYPKTKRTFRASDGSQYIWKYKGDDIQLYNSDDKNRALARLIQTGYSLSKPMRLKLSQECIDILDEVVVTFIVVEEDRREAGSWYNKRDVGHLYLPFIENSYYAVPGAAAGGGGGAAAAAPGGGG